MAGGRRGLVAPQNTFLENIVRRSNGKGGEPGRRRRPRPGAEGEPSPGRSSPPLPRRRQPRALGPRRSRVAPPERRIQVSGPKPVPPVGCAAQVLPESRRPGRRGGRLPAGLRLQVRRHGRAPGESRAVPGAGRDPRPGGSNGA